MRVLDVAELVEKLRIYQGSASNIEMIQKLTGLDEAAFLKLTDELRDLAGVEVETSPKGIVLYTMMMFAAGAILSQPPPGSHSRKGCGSTMRRLGERLGLWKLVWLYDMDEQASLRIARRNGPNGYKAIRMGPFFSPTRVVFLAEDGSITPECYVKCWEWAVARRGAEALMSDSQPCELLLDSKFVLPGWGCCQCRIYNGLQRDACKRCGHKCCAEKPKPEQFGLCNVCGVPEGIEHVGH